MPPPCAKPVHTDSPGGDGGFFDLSLCRFFSIRLAWSMVTQAVPYSGDYEAVHPYIPKEKRPANASL